VAGAVPVREASPVLAQADEAVRLVSADARAAERLARAALVAEDAETRSVASRALGLAALELGDAGAAVAHLRRAVAEASAAGLKARTGEARMSLSFALLLRGTVVGALAEADRAVLELDGFARARMQAQRAVILQKLGRLDEALEGYRRPLAAFRRAGDRLWEARLLCNRGVLQVYRGALGAAEADFRRAEALHEANGQALAATQVRHNFGWVAARRGDVPAALEWFDRVEAEYRAHGVPLALLLMDRCDVLLAARLAADARGNARAAVAELDAAGMGSDLAEALLLAAHAELLGGDAAGARAYAEHADRAFARQRRPAWAALSRAALAHAAWLEVGAAEVADGVAAGRDTVTAAGHGAAAGRDARLEAALGAARRAIRALDAAGWGVEALDARLIAGRAALELGKPRVARRQLELVAAARHRGPVQVRTRGWHAAALLRLSRGDRRGASAAVAAGLRVLDAHRLTLGATELRAHASGHGEDLATLGLRLALASGSPARVLAAAERRRAAALLLRPVRPPDDAPLAADLAELRRVTAALDEALRDGRPDPALLRRQATLERAIRQRTLRTRGGVERVGDRAAAARESGVGGASATAGGENVGGGESAGAGEASAGAGGGNVGAGGASAVAGGGNMGAGGESASVDGRLGRRVLVEFFALDGRVRAVTVTDGRARLHELGGEAEVNHEAASLRFSLRSVATARPGSRAATALHDVTATVAKRLDAHLIAPLRLPEHAPLVLVPTGELHALPWALLPSLAHRPLTVAPSLRLWERAQDTHRPARNTVLVAGPRLPAATAEIETLRHRHPHAATTTLTHAAATVAATLAALDGADAAHIAAHGHFRDDNPQFCSLELADGHLTVYDLERLTRAPRTLILSSCESGLSTVHAGDELMGFTAALLALGTRTVIAAVVPVPDAATQGLMLALDEARHRGLTPAQALAAARTTVQTDAAFVCFGAG